MPYKTTPLLIIICITILLVLYSCENHTLMKANIYETSAAGRTLEKLAPIENITSDTETSISINPDKQYQTITGFGGSFTESAAYLLTQLSEKKQKEIMDAYFSTEGANYSLTRTHINSCDFSLSQYAYATQADDFELETFDISHDRKFLIPMIKQAQQISKDGFKIISSPWTAPPWMKTNNDWVGGKLKNECRKTWALYFEKYLEAYKKEGIDIWGLTVENEPLGNGNNWESMHYSPKEMTDFVEHYLGPQLKSGGWSNVKILGYDQNREHLEEWIDEMYRNDNTRNYFDGTAIHWYASTYEVFPDALEYAHQKTPEKHIIQTEACIDAEVPKWKDDSWYWQKEATDWGWDWAPEKDKKYHPKYRPTYRYARDIIGCLNHWVDGWVDWNMFLNRKGGPNWFKNWCIAPVIVDTENDEVYFTPLFYVMTHFSKFIRPGAIRIHLDINDNNMIGTAVQNPDKSVVIVLFNPTMEKMNYYISEQGAKLQGQIDAQAIQTIVIKD